MKVIESLLTEFLAFLCRLFEVTPESFGRGRRGNLPPPQGAERPISTV